MRDLFRYMTACTLGASGAAAQVPTRTPAPADSAAVVASVEALRRAADSAAARRDSAAFRALVTADFGFAHSTGLVDDAARYLRRPARPGAVRLLTPTRYIASAEVVVAIGHAATPAPGGGWSEAPATDVYRREAGGWRWAWHQTTRVPGRPAFVALGPEVLDGFAGRYVAADGRAFAVSREGDYLVLAGPDGSRPRYRPLTPATFRAEAVAQYLLFGRDAAGVVAYADMLRADLDAAVRLARAREAAR